MGRQCYGNEEYFYAVPWLQEALTKYEGEINKTVTLEDILSHLAFSTYKRGTLHKYRQNQNNVYKTKWAFNQRELILLIFIAGYIG